jgi:hypothetical protein
MGYTKNEDIYQNAINQYNILIKIDIVILQLFPTFALLFDT